MSKSSLDIKGGIENFTAGIGQRHFTESNKLCCYTKIRHCFLSRSQKQLRNQQKGGGCHSAFLGFLSEFVVVEKSGQWRIYKV